MVYILSKKGKICRNEQYYAGKCGPHNSPHLWCIGQTQHIKLYPFLVAQTLDARGWSQHPLDVLLGEISVARGQLQGHNSFLQNMYSIKNVPYLYLHPDGYKQIEHKNSVNFLTSKLARADVWDHVLDDQLDKFQGGGLFTCDGMITSRGDLFGHAPKLRIYIILIQFLHARV